MGPLEAVIAVPPLPGVRIYLLTLIPLIPGCPDRDRETQAPLSGGEALCRPGGHVWRREVKGDDGSSEQHRTHCRRALLGPWAGR